MDTESWQSGVLDVGRQLAGCAVRDGSIATVFGGAAVGTITAGGEGLSALRGWGVPGASQADNVVACEGTGTPPLPNAVPERAPGTPDASPAATDPAAHTQCGTGPANATPEQRLAEVQGKLEEVGPRLQSAAPAEVRQAAREEGLTSVRNALGDLDTPEAAAVLKGLEGRELKGLEQGLVAQQGDRVIFVDGNGRLNDVTVTPENAKGLMADIKAADETLGRSASSYDLRQSVVERSGGQVTTADGYTYTPPTDPKTGQPIKGDALKQWRMDPNNWLPERRAVQQQLYTQGVDRAQALSDLADPNTIYALRGNTAAGKSTAVKSHPQFRELGPALDGAINPDTYKFGLRKADASADGLMTVSSRQVHEEGSVIAARIEQEMLSRPNSSLVFDKRFHEAKDISELLAKAEASGKQVKIVDLDAPLELSSARVLTRTASGDAPLVPFDAVAEGFEGIRKNRGEMLFGADGNGGIVNNPRVRDYELYVVNDQGQPVRVAYKENGVWHDPTPENQALFDKAVSTDTSDNVASMRNQVIDQAFIDRMANTAPPAFRDQMRASLEAYRGQTLKEALDARAKLLNDPDKVPAQ